MSNTILIFAKWPEAGNVKTRLAKDIGDEEALIFYRNMVQQTIRIARELEQDSELHSEVVLQFSPPEKAMHFQEWLGDDITYRPQSSGDLGERLAQGMETAFQAGSEKVLVIGTDCPKLKSEHLCQAFNVLLGKDAVIGGAKDGGYYLLGLNAPWPDVFQDIEWSTSRVFQQTTKRFKENRLQFDRLEVLRDVDTLSDLRIIQRGREPTKWGTLKVMALSLLTGISSIATGFFICRMLRIFGLLLDPLDFPLLFIGIAAVTVAGITAALRYGRVIGRGQSIAVGIGGLLWVGFAFAGIASLVY